MLRVFIAIPYGFSAGVPQEKRGRYGEEVRQSYGMATTFCYVTLRSFGTTQ